MNPIDPDEAPLNLVVVAAEPGPPMAVAWYYPTKAWTFQPNVAGAILFADDDESRTRRVDRATAVRESPRFTSTPVPSEEVLSEI